MKSQQFNICQSHFAEMALENFTKHFRKPNLIRMRLGSIESGAEGSRMVKKFIQPCGI